MNTQVQDFEPSGLLLVVGRVDWLNGRMGSEDPDKHPWLYVSIPPACSEVGFNTIFLSFTGDEEVTVTCRWGDKETSAALAVHRLFDGLSLGSDTLPSVLTPFAIQACGSMVPLFIMKKDGPRLDVYSQIRFTGSDALFIRTGTDEAKTTSMSPKSAMLSRLRSAVALHACNAHFLNNHQRYYKKGFAGKEVEVKFTLAGRPDIWALNAAVEREVSRQGIQGFRCEYRDEFQQWDYLSHIYEVVREGQSCGYVALIETTDGRYLIKEKYFRSDSLIREEKISGPVSIIGPLVEFAKQRFGVDLRELPCFRRVRYDVNLESLESGHVFGIFFDCVSLPSDPDVQLHQCEVEYLRSRVVNAPDEKVIWQELEVVLQFVRSFLQRKGLQFKEGHYSKLSFLRDHLKTKGL